MAGEPPKSQSWWQTLPGILTAVAAIITASTGLIVALNNVGALSGESKPDSPTPTVVLSAAAPATPATSAATGLDAMEQMLNAANIQLSTGGPEEREKVRGYFDGPQAPYYLLAVSCLQILENQQLKKTGYLDMIDKHYSMLVGEGNYVSADGKLHLEKVKEAMVLAQRDYHGDQARTVEEIVESR
ncbi:MAG: hypothetical protein SF097_20015 [Acidobacteriota bacterium]|nr:hypothetical protein [Acidobacteriota bacterium]